MSSRCGTFRVGLAAAFAGALAAGFLAGRVSARVDAGTGADDAAAQSTQNSSMRADSNPSLASDRVSGVPERSGPLVVQPLLGAVGDAGAAPEGTVPAAQVATARAVERLLEQVRISAGRPEFTGQPLEGRVNAMNLYYDGWVDAASAFLGPQGIDAREPVRAALCDPAIDDEEAAALVRVAVRIPGGGSPPAIDCALGRAHAEGYLLWETLDAWRSLRIPPTDDIERWRERARDPRTQRRFAEDHARGRREQ